MARDLAPRGITINNVQAGPTATDMGPAEGPLADVVLATMPIQRLGTTDEVASLVAYLASPEASLITGASLMVDGDSTT